MHDSKDPTVCTCVECELRRVVATERKVAISAVIVVILNPRYVQSGPSRAAAIELARKHNLSAEDIITALASRRYE